MKRKTLSDRDHCRSLAGNRRRRANLEVNRQSGPTALALAVSGIATSIFTQSVDGKGITISKIVSGMASLQQQGPATTIIASDHAIINYQSFDVLRQQSVDFVLPSSTSSVLNRIQSATPAQINGHLQSNGTLYFVDPAGIVFGPHSVVSVGGLCAAAGNLADADYQSGNNHFTQVQGNITNAGTIHATDVALVAASVVNSGVVVADHSVTMVSGGEVYLGSANGNMMVNITAAATAKPSTGNDSGLGSGDMFSMAVVNRGAVSAPNITLQADKTTGTAIVSGKLNASTKSAGATGGNITVTAGTVSLKKATLNASGPAGGGNIRVGGDFHGQGTIPTANNTTVDADSKLLADATQSGNGGTVVVWSDAVTSFAGFLSAKGVAGGSAEVSGKQNLSFTGGSDLSGSSGTKGTLLLDPDSITVGGAPVPFSESTPGSITVDSDLTTETLNALLGTGDVVISAHDNVTVDPSAAINPGGTTSLTLTANNGFISIKGDITIGGNFLATANTDFTATGHSITASTINVIATNGSITGGGYVSTASTTTSPGVMLTAGSAVTAESVTSNVAQVAISAGGNIGTLATPVPTSTPNLSLTATNGLINVQSSNAGGTSVAATAKQTVTVQQTSGDLTVGGAISGSSVTLQAQSTPTGNGNIVEGSATPTVTATAAAGTVILNADGSVGPDASGNTPNPILTSAANLSLTATNGSINVQSSNAAGTSVAATAIQTVTVQQTSGDLTVGGAISGSSVTLQAQSTPTGNGNIVEGSATPTVTATAAAGTVTLNADGSVGPDASGNTPNPIFTAAASLSLTATKGSINLQSSNAAGTSVAATAKQTVTVQQTSGDLTVGGAVSGSSVTLQAQSTPVGSGNIVEGSYQPPTVTATSATGTVTLNADGSVGPDAGAGTPNPILTAAANLSLTATKGSINVQSSNAAGTSLVATAKQTVTVLQTSGDLTVGGAVNGSSVTLQTSPGGNGNILEGSATPTVTATAAAGIVTLNADGSIGTPGTSGTAVVTSTPNLSATATNGSINVANSGGPLAAAASAPINQTAPAGSIQIANSGGDLTVGGTVGAVTGVTGSDVTLAVQNGKNILQDSGFVATTANPAAIVGTNSVTLEGLNPGDYVGFVGSETTPLTTDTPNLTVTATHFNIDDNAAAVLSFLTVSTNTPLSDTMFGIADREVVWGGNGKDFLQLPISVATGSFALTATAGTGDTTFSVTTDGAKLNILGVASGGGNVTVVANNSSNGTYAAITIAPITGYMGVDATSSAAGTPAGSVMMTGLTIDGGTITGSSATLTAPNGIGQNPNSGAVQTVAGALVLNSANSSISVVNNYAAGATTLVASASGTVNVENVSNDLDTGTGPASGQGISGAIVDLTADVGNIVNPFGGYITANTVSLSAPKGSIGGALPTGTAQTILIEGISPPSTPPVVLNAVAANDIEVYSYQSNLYVAQVSTTGGNINLTSDGFIKNDKPSDPLLAGIAPLITTNSQITSTGSVEIIAKGGDVGDALYPNASQASNNYGPLNISSLVGSVDVSAENNVYVNLIRPDSSPLALTSASAGVTGTNLPLPPSATFTATTPNPSTAPQTNYLLIYSGSLNVETSKAITEGSTTPTLTVPGNLALQSDGGAVGEASGTGNGPILANVGTSPTGGNLSGAADAAYVNESRYAPGSDGFYVNLANTAPTSIGPVATYGGGISIVNNAGGSLTVIPNSGELTLGGTNPATTPVPITGVTSAGGSIEIEATGVDANGNAATLTINGPVDARGVPITSTSRYAGGSVNLVANGDLAINYNTTANPTATGGVYTNGSSAAADTPINVTSTTGGITMSLQAAIESDPMSTAALFSGSVTLQAANNIVVGQIYTYDGKYDSTNYSPYSTVSLSSTNGSITDAGVSNVGLTVANVIAHDIPNLSASGDILLRTSVDEIDTTTSGSGNITLTQLSHATLVSGGQSTAAWADNKDLYLGTVTGTDGGAPATGAAILIQDIDGKTGNVVGGNFFIGQVQSLGQSQPTGVPFTTTLTAGLSIQEWTAWKTSHTVAAPVDIRSDYINLTAGTGIYGVGNTSFNPPSSTPPASAPLILAAGAGASPVSPVISATTLSGDILLTNQTEATATLPSSGYALHPGPVTTTLSVTGGQGGASPYDGQIIFTQTTGEPLIVQRAVTQNGNITITNYSGDLTLLSVQAGTANANSASGLVSPGTGLPAAGSVYTGPSLIVANTMGGGDILIGGTKGAVSAQNGDRTLGGISQASVTLTSAGAIENVSGVSLSAGSPLIVTYQATLQAVGPDSSRNALVAVGGVDTNGNESFLPIAARVIAITTQSGDINLTNAADQAPNPPSPLTPVTATLQVTGDTTNNNAPPYNGAITFAQSGGQALTVNRASTENGNITLSNDSADLTLVSVAAGLANGLGVSPALAPYAGASDISASTTGSVANIYVGGPTSPGAPGTITAENGSATIEGSVTLNSTGAVVSGPGADLGAPLIVADKLTINSAVPITDSPYDAIAVEIGGVTGSSGTMIEFGLPVASRDISLTASSSDGDIYVINAADQAPHLPAPSPVTASITIGGSPSGSTVPPLNGSILFYQTGSPGKYQDLEVVSAKTAPGGDIVLSNEDANLSLDTIVAFGSVPLPPLGTVVGGRIYGQTIGAGNIGVGYVYGEGVNLNAAGSIFGTSTGVNVTATNAEIPVSADVGFPVPTTFHSQTAITLVAGGSIGGLDSQGNQTLVVTGPTIAALANGDVDFLSQSTPGGSVVVQFAVSNTGNVNIAQQGGSTLSVLYSTALGNIAVKNDNNDLSLANVVATGDLTGTTTTGGTINVDFVQGLHVDLTSAAAIQLYDSTTTSPANALQSQSASSPDGFLAQPVNMIPPTYNSRLTVPDIVATTTDATSVAVDLSAVSGIGTAETYVGKGYQYIAPGQTLPTGSQITFTAINISAVTTNGDVALASYSKQALADPVIANILQTGTGAVDFDQIGGMGLTVTMATTGSGDIGITNLGADITLNTIQAGTAPASGLSGKVVVEAINGGNISVGQITTTATSVGMDLDPSVPPGTPADATVMLTALGGLIGPITPLATPGVIVTPNVTASKLLARADGDIDLTFDPFGAESLNVQTGFVPQSTATHNITIVTTGSVSLDQALYNIGVEGWLDLAVEKGVNGTITITQGTIDTNGGDQTYQRYKPADDPAMPTVNAVIDPIVLSPIGGKSVFNGGNLTFYGMVDAGSSGANLTVTPNGKATFMESIGDSAPVGTFTGNVGATGATLLLNHNLYAISTIDIFLPTTLDPEPPRNATINSKNGAITFESTLSADAPSDTVTISTSAAEPILFKGMLTITAADSVVSAQDAAITAEAPVSVTGDTTLFESHGGPIDFQDSLTIAVGGSTITTSGGTLTFGGTTSITATDGSTLDTTGGPSGDITFDASTTIVANGAGSLIETAGGSITAATGIPIDISGASSEIDSAGGKQEYGGKFSVDVTGASSITSKNDLTFDGNTTIQAATSTISSGGGALTFAPGVTASITAPTGGSDIETAGGAITTGTGSSLTIEGSSSTINSGGGSETYGGTVTIDVGGASTITSTNDVTFDDTTTITASSSSINTGGGALTIAGNVVASITVTDGSDIETAGGKITTGTGSSLTIKGSTSTINSGSGSETYGGMVVIDVGGASTITSTNDVTFDNTTTITATSSSIDTGGGALTIAGNVVASISVTDGSDIETAGGNIKTGTGSSLTIKGLSSAIGSGLGMQTYGGTLTIEVGGASTINAENSVTFDDTTTITAATATLNTGGGALTIAPNVTASIMAPVGGSDIETGGGAIVTGAGSSLTIDGSTSKINSAAGPQTYGGTTTIDVGGASSILALNNVTFDATITITASSSMISTGGGILAIAPNVSASISAPTGGSDIETGGGAINTGSGSSLTVNGASSSIGSGTGAQNYGSTLDIEVAGTSSIAAQNNITFDGNTTIIAATSTVNTGGGALAIGGGVTASITAPAGGSDIETGGGTITTGADANLNISGASSTVDSDGVGDQSYGGPVFVSVTGPSQFISGGGSIEFHQGFSVGQSTLPSGSSTIDTADGALTFDGTASIYVSGNSSIDAGKADFNDVTTISAGGANSIAVTTSGGIDFAGAATLSGNGSAANVPGVTLTTSADSASITFAGAANVSTTDGEIQINTSGVQSALTFNGVTAIQATNSGDVKLTTTGDSSPIEFQLATASGSGPSMGATVSTADGNVSITTTGQSSPITFYGPNSNSSAATITTTIFAGTSAVSSNGGSGNLVIDTQNQPVEFGSATNITATTGQISTDGAALTFDASATVTGMVSFAVNTAAGSGEPSGGNVTFASTTNLTSPNFTIVTSETAGEDGLTPGGTVNIEGDLNGSGNLSVNTLGGDVTIASIHSSTDITVSSLLQFSGPQTPTWYPSTAQSADVLGRGDFVIDQASQFGSLDVTAENITVPSLTAITPTSGIGGRIWLQADSALLVEKAKGLKTPTNPTGIVPYLRPSGTITFIDQQNPNNVTITITADYINLGYLGTELATMNQANGPVIDPNSGLPVMAGVPLQKQFSGLIEPKLDINGGPPKTWTSEYISSVATIVSASNIDFEARKSFDMGPTQKLTALGSVKVNVASKSQSPLPGNNPPPDANLPDQTTPATVSEYTNANLIGSAIINDINSAAGITVSASTGEIYVRQRTQGTLLLNQTGSKDLYVLSEDESADFFAMEGTAFNASEVVDNQLKSVVQFGIGTPGQQAQINGQTVNFGLVDTASYSVNTELVQPNSYSTVVLDASARGPFATDVQLVPPPQPQALPLATEDEGISSANKDFLRSVSIEARSANPDELLAKLTGAVIYDDSLPDPADPSEVLIVDRRFRDSIANDLKKQYERVWGKNPDQYKLVQTDARKKVLQLLLLYRGNKTNKVFVPEDFAKFVAQNGSPDLTTRLSAISGVIDDIDVLALTEPYWKLLRAELLDTLCPDDPKTTVPDLKGLDMDTFHDFILSQRWKASRLLAMR